MPFHLSGPYGVFCRMFHDSKVHGANMGPVWGRQDPGGPHAGPMNFAIWVAKDRAEIIIIAPIWPTQTWFTAALKMLIDCPRILPALCLTLPPWWRHQMEILSALLASCAGNSPDPGEFSAQRQWRGALMFSLICTRINGWVNHGEAGDLRRHHAH